MEPPSPILKVSNVEADPASDDPLSNCIFVILNSVADTDEYGAGRFALCIYSMSGGLAFVGTAPDTIS